VRSFAVIVVAIVVCGFIACSEGYSRKSVLAQLEARFKSSVGAGCGNMHAGCPQELPCCCKPAGSIAAGCTGQPQNCAAGVEDDGHHHSAFGVCKPKKAAEFDAKIDSKALAGAWSVFEAIGAAGADFFKVTNGAAMSQAKEDLIDLHGYPYDTHFGFAFVEIRTNGGVFYAVSGADNSLKSHTEKVLLGGIDGFVAALQKGGLTVKKTMVYFVLDKTPCSAGPDCKGFIAKWIQTNANIGADVNYQNFQPKQRN